MTTHRSVCRGRAPRVGRGRSAGTATRGKAPRPCCDAGNRIGNAGIHRVSAPTPSGPDPVTSETSPTGAGSRRGPALSLDTEGVHAIANTEIGDRVADIVFVHGLDGGSHRTWRHGRDGEPGHFFWPEELGRELPRCGVWTVGYAAGITELGNPGMIIEKRAGNLAQQLALAGVGVGGKALFFITHSMGGLVIKSLIVQGQLRDDLRHKALVASIRGVVFCGTPHRGAAMAKAASCLGRYVGGVFSALVGGALGWGMADALGRLLGTQAHVRQMEANAEGLDLLHDQFLAWHRAHPILIETYAESLCLFRRRWFLAPLSLGMVVPRASANPGVGCVYDVDADHLELVRPSPSRPENFVFRGVLDFVRRGLEADPGPTRPSGLSEGFLLHCVIWLEAVEPSNP